MSGRGRQGGTVRQRRGRTFRRVGAATRDNAVSGFQIVLQLYVILKRDPLIVQVHPPASGTDPDETFQSFKLWHDLEVWNPQSGTSRPRIYNLTVNMRARARRRFIEKILFGQTSSLVSICYETRELFNRLSFRPPIAHFSTRRCATGYRGPGGGSTPVPRERFRSQ